jgi:hypothetical protein
LITALALPDRCNSPSKPGQCSRLVGVTLDVSIELGAPVFGVTLWPRSEGTARISVLMPEATVNLDDDTALAEDEVRLAGQLFDVGAIPITKPVENPRGRLRP